MSGDVGASDGIENRDSPHCQRPPVKRSSLPPPAIGQQQNGPSDRYDRAPEERIVISAARPSLVGTSIEWTGVHHSVHGDFTDLSTHTVTYETETTCYVTVSCETVSEASYTYMKLDERMAIVVYRPEIYQGRTDVVLNAMLDFESSTDRAVITAGGVPFAVADGDMRFVPTPSRT